MFQVRPYREDIAEGWLNPPDDYLPPPADTVCWQYNIPIDETMAFIQEGSLDQPIVYWLSVKAIPMDDSGPLFGWKSSLDHWNDDAVWAFGPSPFAGPWNEMIYPPGHEFMGQSMDLAFVLNGPTEPNRFDCGDAPDSYQTLLASNGPMHNLGALFLGNLIDAEPDGQPSAAANGDDINNLADEDGIIFVTPLKPNTVAQIDIVSSQVGLLDAWIDWNADGTFTGPNEQIAASWPLTLPLNHLNFTVPAAIAENTQTFARFRVSTAGGLAPGGPYPDGLIPDGEVEDYTVFLEDRYVYKWIQHPDLSPMGIDVNASRNLDLSFILADDFLCTQRGALTDIHIWGSWVDDIFPADGPDDLSFTLSIHKDIPANQNPDGYSKPGPVLWMHTFRRGEFHAEEFAAQIEEGWMDPPAGYFFPADWTCMLYKFHVNPHEAFHQQGTTEDPIVYWLDVQAHINEEGPRFGWKTSVENWNDAAVWGMGLDPFPEFWNELIYPPNHEMAGQSIDLAFALYSDLVTSVPDDDQIPSRTGLQYNFPNPFNPSTIIRYVMPAGGAHAQLEVFDAGGRHVRMLVDGFINGGPAEVTWNGRNDDGLDMPSGVYFYQLRWPGGRQGLKMLLLR